MKAINKWALAVAMLAGLASCEMKNEILGKDPMTGDTGTLNLYVETGKTTKGTTDQVDQFPVTITGTDVEYTKKFDSYAELKQAGDVTLPVGTYTIEACSPGEFKSEMSEPFYGGKVENVKIVKGQTAETSVVCTMQNVKISISFTEEFLATYQDWTITVTDKSGHIKTYTKAKDGETPAPVYWKMDEGVETIYINGTAKTNGNEDVTISGTAKKSNLPEFEEGDDTSFVGGDELKIDFNPVKVEGSTPGIEKDGIQITITLFNSEKNENVEIPVNPGTDGGDTEEPGTGEDGGDEGEGNEKAPTIDLPADFSYSASTGDGKPASADAWLKTPAGLKSAIVKIETTSPAFEATLEDVDMGGNLLEGVELVNNTGIDDLFTGVGLEDRSPKPGVTEYKFPVGAFFTFLDMFTGEHKFHITLTDNEDVTVSDVLTITITE